ncbi:hypothetical protein BYT27DRAFT_7256871 [Phlegmacium glaucopus]|nr:hypothetical protein BYT27DRAFT_7256871 [Phlegmacium glaucopus]
MSQTSFAFFNPHRSARTALCLPSLALQRSAIFCLYLSSLISTKNLCHNLYHVPTWRNVVEQLYETKCHLASVLLQRSIPHDNVTEDVFLSTYEPYFDMLENFGESPPNEQDDVGESPAPETCPVRAPKRPRSPTSEDEDDEYARKTHLDFKALPWNVLKEADQGAATFLSPSLQKTQSLLENFSRDVKRARSSLLNCSKPIPQFPQVEWLNLLSRNAVDLDHVFSNIYTVSFKTRDTIELGKNIELLHDSSTPAKSVKTHGDWVIAWDCMVDAIPFVFEHRKQELQLYGKHIQ